MEDLHEIEAPFTVADPQQKAHFDDTTQFYMLYSGKEKLPDYKLEFVFQKSLQAVGLLKIGLASLLMCISSYIAL